MAKILHADDSESQRNFTRLILKRAGHVVYSAASIREVLAEMEQSRFDLVILSGTLDPRTPGDGARLALGLHQKGQKTLLVSGDDYSQMEIPFCQKSDWRIEYITSVVRQILVS